MLADPRFELSAASFMAPEVPEHCRPYMRTMAEMNGPEHARLRRLASPAFTPRRAAALRPRVEAITGRLLDELETHDGLVDLLADFAGPLPMEVICELVGVPETDRPRWRAYGVAVVTGAGADFAAAVPAIVDGARQAIERRRDEPGDDLISD